jgi:hypothetical protein
MIISIIRYIVENIFIINLFGYTKLLISCTNLVKLRKFDQHVSHSDTLYGADGLTYI